MAHRIYWCGQRLFFFKEERKTCLSLENAIVEKLGNKRFLVWPEESDPNRPNLFVIICSVESWMFALIALLGFRQSFKETGTGWAPRSSFFLNVVEKPWHLKIAFMFIESKMCQVLNIQCVPYMFSSCLQIILWKCKPWFAPVCRWES